VVGWSEAGVARALGLGRSIDRSVLALATELLARDPLLVVQVPVLGESLRADSFAVDVLRKLAAADVDARRLILDIAEPELHSDLEDLLPVLKALRAKGCGLSIAEYGASFSSARILSAVGAGWVRIDRATARPSERLDAGSYFASVIKGAHELGAEVVAPLGMSAAEAEAMGADLFVSDEKVAPGHRRGPQPQAAPKPRIRGRKVA
jgi:EAL domain-containing protein (putative c-di-GMP-specific phosphodiesterase class I)